MTDQINLLPEYLHFESIVDEDTGKIIKGQRNATRISHPITHNSVKITSKATTYDMALSLARGLTAPIIHYDEVEFTQHIKTIIQNSVSTYMTAAENAKKNHSLYGRIMTSTPLAERKMA